MSTPPVKKPIAYRPEPFRPRFPVKTTTPRREATITAATTAATAAVMGVAGAWGNPLGTLTGACAWIGAAGVTWITGRDQRTPLDRLAAYTAWRRQKDRPHTSAVTAEGDLLKAPAQRAIVVPLTAGGAHLSDTTAMEDLHAALAAYLTWSAKSAPLHTRITTSITARTRPFTPGTWRAWHTPRATTTHPVLEKSLTALLSDLTDIARMTDTYATIAIDTASGHAETTLQAAAEQLHRQGITCGPPLTHDQLTALLPAPATAHRDHTMTGALLTSVAEVTGWPAGDVTADLLLPLLKAPARFDRTVTVTHRPLGLRQTSLAMRRVETVSDAIKDHHREKRVTEKVEHATQRSVLNIVRDDLTKHGELLTDTTTTVAVTAEAPDVLTKARQDTEADAAACGLTLTWTRYRHHTARYDAGITAPLEP